MLYSFLLVLVSGELTFTVAQEKQAGYAEIQEAFREALQQYSRFLHPRKNLSQPVEVDLQFLVYRVIDVDEKREMIQVHGFFTLNWTDETLYSLMQEQLQTQNITVKDDFYMNVSPFLLWTPDAVILNRLEPLLLGFDVLVTFTPGNGSVSWSPGGVFVTSCEMNTREFPFDSQECEFVICHWSNANSQQILNAQPTVSNITWLIETDSEWKLAYFKLFENYYGPSFHEYRLGFQRRPQAALLNIILPVCFLSPLNSLVFWVPPDAGEKLSLSVSVLLSFTVFISMVNTSLPTNSTNTSYLEMLLCFQIALGVVCVVLTVLILRLYHRKGDCKQNSYYVRILFPKRNRIIGKHVEEADAAKETKQNKESDKNDNINVHENVGIAIPWSRVARRLDKVFAVVLQILNLMSILLYFVLVLM